MSLIFAFYFGISRTVFGSSFFVREITSSNFSAVGGYFLLQVSWSGFRRHGRREKNSSSLLSRTTWFIQFFFFFVVYNTCRSRYNLTALHLSLRFLFGKKKNVFLKYLRRNRYARCPGNTRTRWISRETLLRAGWQNSLYKNARRTDLSTLACAKQVRTARPGARNLTIPITLARITSINYNIIRCTSVLTRVLNVSSTRTRVYGYKSRCYEDRKMAIRTDLLSLSPIRAMPTSNFCSGPTRTNSKQFTSSLGASRRRQTVQ